MNIQQIVSQNPNLSFLPIKSDKRPSVETWSWKEKVDYNFNNCYGIGLICGSISGDIEVIDIDCKYDLTGSLFQRFKKAINEADASILKNLVVQSTPSGGYHFIYRCKTRTKNSKLARRHSTAEEISKNPSDKVKVLIETRGDGGYFAVWPTKGYEIKYGDISDIKYITDEQRNTIFEVAGTFNEYFQEFKPTVKAEKKKVEGLTPFEDYNQRGDVVALLESHGWKVSGHKGTKTLLLRPGDSKASHSGNWDEEQGYFSVFSTSTQFEPEHGYRPYAVFGVLECNKDWSETARRLYAMGYGDRIEDKVKNTQPIEIESDTENDNDLSFLATEEDYKGYIKSLRDGSFEMGKTTGFPDLDNYFLIKEGSLVIINGHDNVGKSVVIWYMQMLAALQHGWQFIVLSSENSVGGFMRKMIEFYCVKR